MPLVLNAQHATCTMLDFSTD